MKNKYYIGIILIGLIALLWSCKDADDTDYNTSLPDIIKLKAEPGMTKTYISEKAKITSYSYIENENALVMYPSICIADHTVYSFLQYPREEALQLIGMSDEEETAYFEKKSPVNQCEIEVYNDFTDAQPDNIITIEVPHENNTKLHEMYYDPEEKIFIFKGVENIDNEWVFYYYTYDMTGRLLSRKPLPDLDWNGSRSYRGRYLFKSDSIYYLEELPYDWRAQYHEHRIMNYDLLTDQKTEIETDNAIAMFETNDVIYYITQNFDEYDLPESMNLLRLEGNDSVVVHEKFLPTVRTLHDVEYDSVNQILYFSNGEYIYSYSFDDGITRTIMMSGDKRLSICGITDDVIIVTNGNYATTAYERTTEKVSLTDNQVTLNLYRKMSLDDTDRHQDIFRIMTVNGYSAKGETYAIEDTEEYQFAMAKKLLAGDTDFDIFYVSTEMADLMKGQYYEDLSQYPLLNGYYDRMVPGVKELCTIDGLPALVPVNLYTNSMRVDKSCVTGDVKLERTLEELLKIKDDIPLKSGNYFFSGTNLYVLMRPWFEQLVSNYMAEFITDKQAEKDMKLLFEMGMNLADDGDVYLNSGAATTPTLLRAVQNIGLDGSLKPEQTMVPMLKVAEDYKQTWNGGFYAINPNSPNKEMAAVFLACLMERDRNLGFGNAQLYVDAPEKTGIARGNDSDVLYEIYLDQLADGIRGYEIPDFGDTLRDLFKKIDNGEYNAEAAAEELFRQVKMIRYE